MNNREKILEHANERMAIAVKETQRIVNNARIIDTKQKPPASKSIAKTKAKKSKSDIAPYESAIVKDTDYGFLNRNSFWYVFPLK